MSILLLQVSPGRSSASEDEGEYREKKSQKKAHNHSSASEDEGEYREKKSKKKKSPPPEKKDKVWGPLVLLKQGTPSCMTGDYRSDVLQSGIYADTGLYKQVWSVSTVGVIYKVDCVSDWLGDVSEWIILESKNEYKSELSLSVTVYSPWVWEWTVLEYESERS